MFGFTFKYWHILLGICFWDNKNLIILDLLTFAVVIYVLLLTFIIVIAFAARLLKSVRPCYNNAK